MEQYVRALLVEARKYQGLSFETLYFGGGTPSLLSVTNLRYLINGLQKCFAFTSSPLVGEDTGDGSVHPHSTLSPQRKEEADIEATVEVNPESATPEFLTAALECGFNRLSIGVQSLNDLELTAVGRVHNANQAITAVQLAKAAGFTNISADLIIGLPGQTWRSLKYSIIRLLTLDIQHLSVYCLSLENETPLAPRFESSSTELSIGRLSLS